MMTTRNKIQIGMAIGASLFVIWILILARSSLVPFFIGAILAYLLAPLVDTVSRAMPFYERREALARTVSIFLIYLIGALLLVVGGLLVLPDVVRDVGQFIQRSPAYLDGAREQFDRWSHLYDELPPEIRLQIDDGAERVTGMAGQVAQQVAQRTFGFVTQTFSIVIGFFAVPFWLFYVLKDQNRTTAWLHGAFPAPIRKDVRAILAIINHVLGSYIRGQLTLAIVVGSVTTVGLLLLGVPSAVALGVLAGFTELIPILGPIIAAIIAGTVTLATEPSLTPWVLLFFLAVQQLENAFLVPRIQGHAVELHPAIIIILLVIANQLLGIWGMLIAVPLAAVARDTFVYIYRRLDEESPLEAILDTEHGQQPSDQVKLVRRAFPLEEITMDATAETEKSSPRSWWTMLRGRKWLPRRG